MELTELQRAACAWLIGIKWKYSNVLSVYEDRPIFFKSTLYKIELFSDHALLDIGMIDDYRATKSIVFDYGDPELTTLVESL